MTKDISKFLDLLTRRGLLSDRVLANLHRQVAEKGERGKTVRLEALANLLVEKGHLTRHQADAVVAECRQPQRDADSELGLAPIDEEGASGEWDAASDDRPDAAFAETRAATDDLSEAQAAALLRPVDAQAESSTPSPTHGQRPLSGTSIIDELPVDAVSSSTRPARRERQTTKKNEWDSPLLLIGGGALLLLLLVGGLVWYLVRTDTGNAQLQAARTAYEDGAYSQAIEEYEQFLNAHGGHDEASAARVQLGLARIRRTLDSGAAFEDVLTQSQHVITQIEGEQAFGEAGRELAAILPEIAEGLAGKARQADARDTALELTAKTEAALALLTNTKYVPKSFRPQERIDGVRNSLASVHRRQERQKDLEVALSGITAAMNKRDFQEAYRLYRQLVEKHADAAQLEEVLAAAKLITSAEVAAIQFQPDRHPASTDERGGHDVVTVLLATTLQEGAADGGRNTAFVRIEGALFAIDAATGEFLWRRYVGIAPHLPPLSTPEGDALVIDVEHGELVRLAGRTGELIWRQTIGDAVGNAALASGTALVPTADARLVFIDPDIGEAQGFVQFAQPLATTPAIDAETKRILVVGDHSSVYVLSADGKQGEGAIFVGHAAGSVSVPAAGFGQTICVVENFAADRSRLHAFSLAAARTRASAEGDDATDNRTNKTEWTSRTQPIRLTGRVTTPMATDGRRIAIVTDLGDIRVFDFATSAEGPPLSPIASRDATGEDALDRYLTLNDSDLWLADTRLTRLKVLAAGGRLQAQDLASAYGGDAFTHPLVVIGDRILHVRRPRDRAGYLIGATGLQSGDALWEAEAAAGPVDVSLMSEQRGFLVAMANGRVYEVESFAMHRAATNNDGVKSYLVAADRIASFNFTGDWAVAIQSKLDSDHTAARDTDNLLVTPTLSLDTPSHPFTLPAPPDARPLAFRGGLLVPLRIGQVLLLNPATGGSLAAPFQPPLRPTRLPEWTRTETVAPNSSFVIADRRGTVFLVASEQEPDRLTHVNESAPLASRILGELCATSSSVFAATADGQVVVLGLPDLDRTAALELGAGVAWGPFASADTVFIATTDNQFYALTHDGGVLTQASISAPVVGRPTVVNDRTSAIALADGSLLGVDVAARSVVTLGAIGQPLAVGPLLLDDRICAATPDGTLVSLPVDLPSLVATAAGVK